MPRARPRPQGRSQSQPALVRVGGEGGLSAKYRTAGARFSHAITAARRSNRKGSRGSIGARSPSEAAASPSDQNLPSERAYGGGAHSIGDQGRHGSRHSLGPVRPTSECKAESAGGVPGHADPHWRGSPPGSASNRKEGVSRVGGVKQRRREQEEGWRDGGTEGGTAAGLPHLSIIRQIKSPLCEPGRGMYPPTEEPLLHFSDSAEGRCSCL